MATNPAISSVKSSDERRLRRELADFHLNPDERSRMRRRMRSTRP